ncbi:hypothetical protein ANO14919_092100 [Xylariales sp. No.14919]|nr:hypothetical protein ANO14919_092100 [Xylariales sp. No.14919]
MAPSLSWKIMGQLDNKTLGALNSRPSITSMGAGGGRMR